MTKDIVIELQHLGDSTPHNQGRSTIYSAISEIERLRQLGDTMAYFVRSGDGKEMYSAVHAWEEFRRG